MKTLAIPGTLRSLWQAAGLSAAAAMGSLLLAAPVTAGAVHAVGHQHAMVLLTGGMPIPGPHVLADGNPAPPTTTPPSAADGSPVPSPH